MTTVQRLHCMSVHIYIPMHNGNGYLEEVVCEEQLRV